MSKAKELLEGRLNEGAAYKHYEKVQSAFNRLEKLVEQGTKLRNMGTLPDSYKSLLKTLNDIEDDSLIDIEMESQEMDGML